MAFRMGLTILSFSLLVVIPIFVAYIIGAINQ
jgi:hypothetical protein